MEVGEKVEEKMSPWTTASSHNPATFLRLGNALLDADFHDALVKVRVGHVGQLRAMLVQQVLENACRALCGSKKSVTTKKLLRLAMLQTHPQRVEDFFGRLVRVAGGNKAHQVSVLSQAAPLPPTSAAQHSRPRQQRAS